MDRSARPLAIVGTCEADPMTMLRVATKLESGCSFDVIPFVADRGDGVADFGFAAEGWVVDLLEWAMTADIPDKQVHRILGLLLGYSARAIDKHERTGTGDGFRNLYVDSAGSPAPRQESDDRLWVCGAEPIMNAEYRWNARGRVT